jgi:hypothetical protein
MRGYAKAYAWRADLASARGDSEIDAECSNGVSRSEDLVEEDERDTQQSERDPR